MQQTIESVSQPTVNRQTMSIVDEIWKDVTGYEGYYQVSNLGRARSCDRTIYDGRWGDRLRKGKPVSANLGKRGYVYVPLCKLGKSSTMLLHRLVAKAFIGDCPDGYEVNHIDGDRCNNAVSNLEYVTPSQNMRHAYDTGLAKPMCGEMNATALLTNEKVLEIRRLSAQGLKDAAIAPMFGISRVTVYDIRTRKTWKHI